MRPLRPGDVVRYVGRACPALVGHYGIVQTIDKWRTIGVEWDDPSVLHYPETPTINGHDLQGVNLPPGRDTCGWWVSADDVERV